MNMKKHLTKIAAFAVIGTMLFAASCDGANGDNGNGDNSPTGQPTAPPASGNTTEPTAPPASGNEIEPTAPPANGNEQLAGFIEIRGNMLYITPVEVFMQYDGNAEQFSGNHWRAVKFIQEDDTQQMQELGLTAYDFPSGIHIRPNWHSESEWHYVEQAGIEARAFEITDATTFTFRGETTADIEEFMPHLYPSVIHFIEVADGKVIRLIQEFAFTI